MPDPGGTRIWKCPAARQPCHHAEADGRDVDHVPVPLHRELRTGTLRSIIRQSGLSIDTFTAYPRTAQAVERFLSMAGHSTSGKTRRNENYLVI